MLDAILGLLTGASGAIPIAAITVAAFSMLLLTAVVVVALVCNGERAERAVTILRTLLRSRAPRD